MIRERILRVHVDDDALTFNSPEAITAFQSALGKLVSFGMRSDANEGVEFVELYINSDKELMAAMYPPVDWNPTGTPEYIAPFLALGEAIEPFKQEMPRIIGAILQKSGEYQHKC